MKKLLVKSKNKPSKLFGFLLLTSIVIVTAYPVFQDKFLYGDDWAYHLSRIECIKEGLMIGDFSSRIHSSLLNGYGYGSGLFYPNFFLYFPASLRILGFSISVSYKIFILFIITLIAVSTYFSAKYIFKSRYAAFCTTVLFVTSQTVIKNIFKRAAIGESLALIFIPIIICGIYDLIKNKYSKPWILILGFLGLINCHMLTLAVSILFTFIIVVINFKTILKNKNSFKIFNKTYSINILMELILSAILVLMLSANFWLPMIEQMMDNKFAFNVHGIYLSESALRFPQLFELNGHGSIGFPLLIFTLFRVFFINSPRSKRADRFLILGVSLSLITTNIFPWRFFESTLYSLQFPWRLLSFASIFLALGIGGTCKYYCRNKRSRTIILFLMYITSFWFCTNSLNQYVKSLWDSSPTDFIKLQQSIGGGNEWLPLNTDITLLTTPKTVLSDNNVSINANKQGNTISFKYNSDYKCKYFDIPLLYYKGYDAKILKQNGSIEKLETIKSTNNNLVRVLNPGNLSGDIIVGYWGSKVQKGTSIVSILTYLTIFLFFILKVFHHKISLKNKNAF